MDRMTSRYSRAAPDLRESSMGVFRVKQVGNVWVDVLPLLFTAAVVPTPLGSRTTYTNRWCYQTIAAALAATHTWSGAPGTEPEGWHRHPATGRYVTPTSGTPDSL